MYYLKLLFLLFIVFSAFSCKDNYISSKDIDDFITMYEEVEFKEIKNISITWRSRHENEFLYIVGRSEGNFPVYFVSYDLQKKGVSSINREKLEENNVHDYLSKDEIVKAVNLIRKHNFYFLAVDSSENVYFNPFYSNSPPILVRLSVSTEDSVMRRGYVYDLYRGRWYINRTKN